MAEATSLDWTRRGLTIADLTVLGRLLQRGMLPYLQHLRLDWNQMNDESIVALVRGTSKMALENLTHLDLDSNEIGEQGMEVFSEAIAMGALANRRSPNRRYRAPSSLLTKSPWGRRGRCIAWISLST